jgi:hypothetical protein
MSISLSTVYKEFNNGICPHIAIKDASGMKIGLDKRSGIL